MVCQMSSRPLDTFYILSRKSMHVCLMLRAFLFLVAKEAKSCTVDGETYKDGEEFKMGCKMLCTCQNGQHACSTLCPQEDRRPSRLHCREPRLIEIQGQCCKEWTCPLHYQPGPNSKEVTGSVGMLQRGILFSTIRIQNTSNYVKYQKRIDFPQHYFQSLSKL